MAEASSETKNKALQVLIDLLCRERETILEANRLDLAETKLTGPMLERLSLEGRLKGIIGDLKEVLELPDPIGETFEKKRLPNGLHLCKRRTPLGVLGVIYESRPNVTLDISALAIKSGNSVLLRGGAEALHTNRALASLLQRALLAAQLPIRAVQLVDSKDRAKVQELLRLHEEIDLIIPRGSAALQEFCREHSKIPVITGGIGICHLFVDETADLARALDVIANAKMQRPTVCNALDTLLVHKKIAAALIPRVIEKLGIAFRLDPEALRFASGPNCFPACEGDWDTEWLSLVLGVKVVADVHEAIIHIRRHSSGHSDGILTEEPAHRELFLRAVDSAALYVNASTRFTDGGQFGLGSEVAISTQKLHARGPMGLEALTSYKWIVQGDYHVRN